MQEGRCKACYMKKGIFNGVGGLQNTIPHQFFGKVVQKPASPLESTPIVHRFPDKEEKRGENENLKPNQARLQTRGRGGGKKGKRRWTRFEKEGVPACAPSAPAPGFRAPTCVACGFSAESPRGSLRPTAGRASALRRRARPRRHPNRRTRPARATWNASRVEMNRRRR
jgi:hypothetical protein